MVTTRSSPVKKKVEVIELDVDQEFEEDMAPEDVTISIDDSEASQKDLEPTDANPPKLFILPKDASKEARIVTLPDPSSGTPSRYFACPQKGLYEFTRITAPKSEKRSVLLAPAQNSASQKASGDGDTTQKGDKKSIAKGYLSRSPAIFVASPVDPVFFLIPILAPAKAKSQKRLFVTFEDHLDSVTGTLRQLLRQELLRKQFEARLDSICDKVEAGDDSMYRLSTEKLASVMVSKARRMVKNGLPPSMEEKFIRAALQAPLLSIKREDTIVAQAVETESTTTQPSTVASQTLSETSATTASAKDSQSTTFSQVSTTTSATSISISQDSTTNLSADDILPDAPAPSNEATEEVKHLLRLRVALQYLKSCYLPSHIASALSPIHIDFLPLETHLKHLNSLHEEARALRALSDNITRKRGLDPEDDEAAEERSEKKRKKEEEEKKKKTESNALKQLKKVDTSGMKKLSSFFQKAPPKKKT